MTDCRSCGGEGIESILDLGMMPLSDGLRPPEVMAELEARYPLELAFCPECSLVQILEEVDPRVLFCDDYPYYSSFSDSLLRHSKANVEDLIESRSLTEDSLVIELASNDGYFLQYFVERGIPVLGIDPAAGPVIASVEKGIPTTQAFFSDDLAELLVAEGRQADVVIANNVLAHVPDLNGFVSGIARLLKPDGTTSIEAPYVRDLIDGCQFDTIYHEHLCYYSVTSVKTLFARHGLHLNKVEHLDIHGGSLRYYAGPTAEPHESVQRYLEAERKVGLDTIEYYADFGERVQNLRTELQRCVSAVRDRGETIAAYGAAAKGAILLNYVGLDESNIDFVVDRNIHKHGKFMPGVDLEIFDPAVILEHMPDFLLILPWNLEAEIIDQQSEYSARGGKFIVPVPSPRLIDPAGTHA